MLYVADLRERRERTFLVLAGFFLCSMTLLNVIGITRFVQLGTMALAVGVLPYPLTFLCTDLICELYGKARANFLVSVGLGLNVFILLVLFLGNALPSVPAESMPPWQILQLAAPVALRYAWLDFPETNLVNSADLPASPFRTDDWAPIPVPAPAAKGKGKTK